MIAQKLCTLASVRRLSAALLTSAFAVAALAGAVRAQKAPGGNEGRPHFVGFQKADSTGLAGPGFAPSTILPDNSTTIHLNVAGLGHGLPVRIVYKEINRGTSHVLSIIPARGQSSFTMDWVIPVVLSPVGGFDRLTIKMGDTVIFDQQDGAWATMQDGSRSRVPTKPSPRDKV